MRGLGDSFPSSHSAGNGRYTRAHTNIILREAYAAPFLWAAIGAVMLRLRLTGSAARLCSVVLTVLITITLLVWQFGPFVLLVQAIALLACFALGAASEPAVTAVLHAMGIASVATSVLMCGNWMVFCSFVTCTIAMWDVLRRLSAPTTAEPTDRRPFIARAALSLGSLLCGAGLKMASQHVMSLMGVHPDGHITSILRAKIDPGHNDFQTMIYLCGPSFNFMTPDQLGELIETGAMPIAAGAVALGLVSTAIASMRGSHAAAELHGDLVFLGVTTVGYGILATMIARLVVLALPGAIILAAVATSPRMVDWLAVAIAAPPQRSPGDGGTEAQSSTTVAAKAEASSSEPPTGDGKLVQPRGWTRAVYWVVRAAQLMASLALIVHVRDTLAVPTYQDIVGFSPPDPASPEMVMTVNLIKFMSETLPANAVVAADPPLSSTIRALSSFPIVVSLPWSSASRIVALSLSCRPMLCRR